MSEEEKRKPWEVTVKEGILTAYVDLNIPDSITMALGVADRIKSMVLSLEMKAKMQEEMKAMVHKKNGSIIIPGLAGNS